jgi:hypothetical protein
MVDTLAALYRAALADPTRFPYLNLRRAELMRAELPRMAPNQALQYRYYLAAELINGGETRKGIAEIEGLMQAAGISSDSITPMSKPLFDLLAIAYLRLGEQENCQSVAGRDVCILPLARDGRHMKEEGARGAIARYEALLRQFPDDHGSRYLLNIAYMSLGGYPDSVPKQYRIPGLAPGSSPRFPWYPNIAPEVGLGANGLSGGVDVEDFNRDGLLDVFVTSFGLNDQARFYVADGAGRYEERTEEAGLRGIVGGLNSIHADYDNDGFPDILVLRGAWLADAGTWPPSLLRNKGDGSFEDVTFRAGLASFHPTQTAAWGDFNLDGCLDLFIGHESVTQHVPGANPQPSQLFVNDCKGAFRDVSRQVGIDLDDFVKGVGWTDVNNDGLPDLYVSVMDGPNRLFVNRGGAGDQWIFEEQAARAGVQEPRYSFPIEIFDYDQDGWEDLLVMSYDMRALNNAHELATRRLLRLPLRVSDGTGQPFEVERTRLFRNNGDGTFTDLAPRAGVDQVFFAMGNNFGDLDNDGWLDFYVGTGTPDLRAIVPKQMFRNRNGNRFEEVTLPGGFGHLQKGHAVAFADLDRDGDQDIYMVLGGAYEGDWFAKALFENPGWPGRSWIGLELEGTTANRSAIGARVELLAVEPGGRRRRLFRTVGTGGSFGSGPLALHVGLDRATRVETVQVHWPDAARSVTVYRDLEINRYHHVRQGASPVKLERPPVPFRKMRLPHQH